MRSVATGRWLRPWSSRPRPPKCCESSRLPALAFSRSSPPFWIAGHASAAGMAPPCCARDGVTLELVAKAGVLTDAPVGLAIPLDSGSVAGRSIMDAAVVQVEDINADERFSAMTRRGYGDGIGTMIGTPLMRDGEAIGSLVVARPDVRAFTMRQQISSARSQTRPSSPSRTPACSRNWSSATPTSRRATARSRRRWSSRPPWPRSCGSSLRRRRSSSESCRRWPTARCTIAVARGARSRCARATCTASWRSRVIIRASRDHALVQVVR